jgi:cytochrome c peroxidase
MRKSTTTGLFFLMSLLLLSSCSKEVKNTPAMPYLPATPYSYTTNNKDKIEVISMQSGTVTIKPMTITPVSNMTITLGRVIFNDNVITTTNTIHCGSCHTSSPNIQGNNILAPLAGNAHHGAGMESPEVLVTKMAETSYYPRLFRDAYGSSEITQERISDALAQYLSAMVSLDSKEAMAADPRFADPFK